MYVLHTKYIKVHVRTFENKGLALFSFYTYLLDNIRQFKMYKFLLIVYVIGFTTKTNCLACSYLKKTNYILLLNISFHI